MLTTVAVIGLICLCDQNSNVRFVVTKVSESTQKDRDGAMNLFANTRKSTFDDGGSSLLINLELDYRDRIA